jgi:hypothetical protein
MYIGELIWGINGPGRLESWIPMSPTMRQDIPSQPLGFGFSKPQLSERTVLPNGEDNLILPLEAQQPELKSL